MTLATHHLPDRAQAKELLKSHVSDVYQRYHAQMVAAAMQGYAKQLSQDEHLWWLTGYLHDIDYQQFPDTHPKESLDWFAQWHYPESLIHAVEAHAYGYNGFSTLPQTPLASALIACDEISGIFYAYQKLNPIPYGQMKAKSIAKRIKERSFAPKIERESIHRGCDALGVELPTHIENLIGFYATLD